MRNAGTGIFLCVTEKFASLNFTHLLPFHKPQFYLFLLTYRSWSYSNSKFSSSSKEEYKILLNRKVEDIAQVNFLQTEAFDLLFLDHLININTTKPVTS